MSIPVNHNSIVKHQIIKMKMLPKRSKTISKYSLFYFSYKLSTALYGGNVAKRVLDILQVKIKFRLKFFILG